MFNFKRGWLQIVVTASFLFSLVVPPFAQAIPSHQLRTKSVYCVPTYSEQSVQALRSSLAMLHASPVRELLLWILDEEHLRLSPESFANFKDDFIEQMGWILRRSKNGKLLTSLKEMFSQFERVGLFVMIHQLEVIHRSILPQMLSSTLKILLSERQIKLEGNLEDFRKVLEEKFNLDRKKYGVQGILKSVQVIAHEEDSLIENDSKFILAPLTLSKGGKAIFFIHKRLLQKIMENGAWADLLVAREYGILSFLESGIDFDDAHALILEKENQLELWNFVKEIVGEIVKSKTPAGNSEKPLTKSLPEEFKSWEFEMEKLYKIKKLISSPDIILKLRETAAGQIKKIRKRIVEERITPSSVTFTFSDGGWLLIRVDDKKGAVELHISVTSSDAKSKYYETGEDLVRLLELWSREEEPSKEKTEVDPSIEPFRASLIQQESAPVQVQDLPTLKKLLEFSRESGYSDSLVAEFFSPQEVVETTFELTPPETETPQRVKAFYSSLKDGVAMAGILAPESYPRENSVIELKDRIVQIALAIGLLQLPKGNGYGAVGVSHLDLLKKEIKKLVLLFEEKFFLSKVDQVSVMAPAIAKGAVALAKYALVNMDIVDHNTFLNRKRDDKPVVVAGVQGFSQKGFEVASKAIADGFKVVAISKGGEDKKTYYKKDGFTETDLMNLYRKTIQPKATVYKGEEFILEIEGIEVVFLTEGESFLRAENSELLARNGHKVTVEPRLLVEVEEKAIEKSAKELLLAKAREVSARESDKGKLKELTLEQAKKIFEKKVHEHTKGRVYFLPSFLVMALGVASLNVVKKKNEGDSAEPTKERSKPHADIVTEACNKVFLEARIRFKASLEESFFLLEEASYLVALRGFIQLYTPEDRELIRYVLKNLDNVPIEGHLEVPRNFKEFVSALWKNRDLESLANLLDLTETSPQEWASYRILLAYILDLLHSPSLQKEKGLDLFRELLKIHKDTYTKESKPEKKLIKRLEKWGEKLPNTIARAAQQRKAQQNPPYFGLEPGKGLAAFLIGLGLWGASAIGSATVQAAEISSKILLGSLETNWAEYLMPVSQEIALTRATSKVAYLLGEKRSKINKVEVWTFDLTSLRIENKTSVVVPLAVKQMVERILEKSTPNRVRFALVLNENLEEDIVVSIAKKLGIDPKLMVYSKTPQEIFRTVREWGDVSVHVVTANSNAWQGLNVFEIIQLLGFSTISEKDWLGELNFNENILLFYKTQA